METMNIQNESTLFSKENIRRIETLKEAKYVCETEHPNSSYDVPLLCAIFYGNKEHEVSKSRYFALFYNYEGVLVISDGSFVETQEFTGVVADNHDVIYSRHRHDYRTSSDGSVFVDGGRDYLRTNATTTYPMKVVKGELIHVSS